MPGVNEEGQPSLLTRDFCIIFWLSKHEALWTPRPQQIYAELVQRETVSIQLLKNFLQIVVIFVNTYVVEEESDPISTFSYL